VFGVTKGFNQNSVFQSERNQIRPTKFVLNLHLSASYPYHLKMITYGISFTVFIWMEESRCCNWPVRKPVNQSTPTPYWSHSTFRESCREVSWKGNLKWNVNIVHLSLSLSLLWLHNSLVKMSFSCIFILPLWDLTHSISQLPFSNTLCVNFFLLVQYPVQFECHHSSMFLIGGIRLVATVPCCNCPHYTLTKTH